MMSFLKGLLDRGSSALAQFQGDGVALLGIAAAAARVIAADGVVEDNEIDTAIAGMQAHPVLSVSYSGAKIEEAVGNALRQAKTRFGRMELNRSIEALATREVAIRQDVFLIAADVADNDGIGNEEKAVLLELGKLLNVDANKLLG